MKNKHLSYEERMYIEQSLNKGLSVHRIALKLSRPDSSIVREIQRNRYNSDNEHRSYIPCVFKRTELCTARHICGDMDCLRECSYCTIANGCGPKCSEYKPQECTNLNHRVDRHLTILAPHRSVRAAFPHTAPHKTFHFH